MTWLVGSAITRMRPDGLPQQVAALCGHQLRRDRPHHHRPAAQARLYHRRVSPAAFYRWNLLNDSVRSQPTLLRRSSRRPVVLVLPRPRGHQVHARRRQLLLGPHKRWKTVAVLLRWSLLLPSFSPERHPSSKSSRLEQRLLHVWTAVRRIILPPSLNRLRELLQDRLWTAVRHIFQRRLIITLLVSTTRRHLRHRRNQADRSSTSDWSLVSLFNATHAADARKDTGCVACVSCVRCIWCGLFALIAFVAYLGLLASKKYARPLRCVRYVTLGGNCRLKYHPELRLCLHVRVLRKWPKVVYPQEIKGLQRTRNMLACQDAVVHSLLYKLHLLFSKSTAYGKGLYQNGSKPKRLRPKGPFWTYRMGRFRHSHGPFWS